MTKNYAELMTMGRERHRELTTELKALEAAFPGIAHGGGAYQTKRAPRAIKERTAEARARMSEAARLRWVKRKANGAVAETPGIVTSEVTN